MNPTTPQGAPAAHGPGASITRADLKVGMEIHVELCTRSKMFSRAPNPAHASNFEAPPNTLIDATVLALPGALPVPNRAALEMAIAVGLALRCHLSPVTKWDRKSYFYPDLPKAYQISQYDMPVCFDGAFDVPAVDDTGLPDFSRPGTRIGIIRAHLEEDAGKLLHETPGGHALDGSIADYNRAGTPLLEIVTQPDFTSAQQAVVFARLLRQLCRFLGVTEGVMQQGHMRFEPNINCLLSLADGRTVATPVVEVKNLNSFKSLRGAIEHELAEQPRRWLADGRVFGPGTKTTRGWDDAAGVTFVQREKEDAHDYRYFPDPDLTPVRITDEWRSRVEASLPALPLARLRTYTRDHGLSIKEAFSLVDERALSDLYEHATDAMVLCGTDRARAARLAANLLLQQGGKRANERGVPIHALGIGAGSLAGLGMLRDSGAVGNQAVEELFDAACTMTQTAADLRLAATDARDALHALARQRGLLTVRDDASLAAWIDTVLAAHPKAAEDLRAGKVQAAGRLVGEVMKLSAGAADAKTVREEILRRCGQ
ncbi:MAG: Asp-tRNA(Asn)/Glu-tRNA(Gln) amidotransferase subunit GatB [Phycisphaeraceae bacterium]|nr:Asp-tRNA(Asn)/Glu-tRNA(Gln) amidotransferase subunit GatB [Phycisphaeraceae bacterium]